MPLVVPIRSTLDTDCAQWYGGLMACYLSITTKPAECGGCSRTVEPGLIGWTDDRVIGPRLSPLCGPCLHGLDRRLYVLWTLSKHLARPLPELGLPPLVDFLKPPAPREG